MPSAPRKTETKSPHWVLYLLECRGGTLYAGITTDLERRFAEHASGRGARYTRSHASGAGGGVNEVSGSIGRVEGRSGVEEITAATEGGVLYRSTSELIASVNSSTGAAFRAKSPEEPHQCLSFAIPP